MLHFLPDCWQPAAIIAGYRDRIGAGSLLAIAHVTGDGAPPGLAAAAEAYRRTRYPVYPRTQYPRTHEQILGLCAGFDLVEPAWFAFPIGARKALATPRHVNALLCGAVGRKR